MNTSIETMQHQPARETGLKWVAGGSMVEAVGALATIALAIVGLAGILSMTLAAIATIVVGASILIEGGAFSAGAYSSGVGSEVRMAQSSKSPAFLGGVAGVVLGILALLGVSPMTLLSVAVLVYGGTFLLSGLSQEGSLAGTGVETGSGGHFMVGIAAVVLGILAIVGLSQLTLVLVALLSLGAAALFSGSVGGAKSLTAVNRT